MIAKGKLGVGYFFGSIAAVAIICSVCAAWFVRSGSQRHSEHEAHKWLHDRLRLTTEQERQLEPLEQRFAAERAAYLEEVRSANRDLAAALQAEGRFTPKVEAAVERINQAQVKFQKATIRHCLEMREFLTPDQWKQLLEIAAQALNHEGD